MFVTKPNIKSIFNLSVLSLTITTPIRSFGSEQTNPRIPELTRAIEASVTELEGIAYPGQTAPLLRENNSRDQFSLSNLADRLDDVTNELEEQNQIEESRSYRRKCFINSYHFYCHKHRKSDAEIDESLQNKWLIYGFTFRGVLSDGVKFQEQWGAELGLGLSIGYGVDVGMGLGNLFREGGKIISDIRARIFLNHLRRGLYVGGGYVLEVKNKSYGAIGIQGQSAFIEIDVIRDQEKPLSLIPQFGFRFRR